MLLTGSYSTADGSIQRLHLSSSGGFSFEIKCPHWAFSFAVILSQLCGSIRSGDCSLPTRGMFLSWFRWPDLLGHGMCKHECVLLMIRCLTLLCQAGTKQKEGSPTKGALGAGKAYHCAGGFMLRFPGQHSRGWRTGCRANLCTDEKIPGSWCLLLLLGGQHMTRNLPLQRVLFAAVLLSVSHTENGGSERTFGGGVSSPLTPGALGHHPQPLCGQEARTPQVLNPPELREPFHKAGDAGTQEEGLSISVIKTDTSTQRGMWVRPDVGSLDNCFYSRLAGLQDLCWPGTLCICSSRPQQLADGWIWEEKEGHPVLCDSWCQRS